MITNDLPVLPSPPVSTRSGGAAIPISLHASKGVPQSVTVEAGGRRFTVTIIASVADVPALRSVPATQVLMDALAEQTTRVDTVANDMRESMTAPTADSLSPDLIRPSLAVRENGVVVGVCPIVVGRPLRFGTSPSSPLAVEVVVHEFVLTAGMLIRPGETGGLIRADLFLAAVGLDRNETPPASVVNPYGFLA